MSIKWHFGLDLYPLVTEIDKALFILILIWPLCLLFGGISIRGSYPFSIELFAFDS
jgi:hypothetical protein